LHWIAPSEKDSASASLEKRLWDAADEFRANSGLKAQECSGPILGLIFLCFAEVRFAAQPLSTNQSAPLPGFSAANRLLHRISAGAVASRKLPAPRTVCQLYTLAS
jgi:hypothetical protein